MIDQLTKQDNGELCEMYKDYQNLKAENERLKDIVNSVDTLKQYTDDIEEYILVNPKRAYFGSVSLQDIIDLKQQLKEKDEEIEQLKGDYDLLKKTYQGTCVTYKDDHDTLIKLLKSNTKQVCEKIREKFSDGRSHNWGIEQVELYDFLDQIEKGESK